MKLDGKFHGIIAKNKDQSIVPQDQWIVFLAKDNALPATLEFYRRECARQGADPAQIDAVEGLRIRVMQWRAAHPELCKAPDVQSGEIQT
jgi:hypothetical protein